MAMLNPLETKMLAILQAVSDEAGQTDGHGLKPVPVSAPLVIRLRDVLAQATEWAKEDPIETQVREAAMTVLCDDECEIDPHAVVSISEDGGAWVQAWVYISNSDLIEQGVKTDEDEHDLGCPAADGFACRCEKSAPHTPAPWAPRFKLNAEAAQ